MKRYAAKLLFQFRVVTGDGFGVRRICEERIVCFKARSALAALRLAKQRGRSARREYLNSDGNRVHFEFVGVLDLLHLGSECEPDEVWYNIVERVRPMERKAKLIPREQDLCAIRNKE